MAANDQQAVYLCAQCGKCCRWPGPVHVDAAEIGAIADSLKMSPREFADRYTRLLDNRSGLSLAETRDGCCILLSGNRCLVHGVKPRQCRCFPDGWRFPGFEHLCNAKQIGARS